MPEEAVKLLKPLDKIVLEEPTSAIEITSVKDAVYVSFDNVYVPLTPLQLSELHGYCGRAIEVLTEYKKRK